jgi:hypothetical protein
MQKQKVLFFIPLLIIVGLLIDTWVEIFFTDTMASWRHYTALILFAVIIFLYLQSFTKAVLATGAFLILATCNLLGLTATITTTKFGLNIGPDGIYTPSFQLLSLGIFLLYFFLNIDTLINIQLDYKEAKALKMQNKA